MKILFIQTNLNSSNKFTFSFGINSIAAVLEKNSHECGYYLVSSTCGQEHGELKNQIEGFEPDVLAFTAITSQFEHVRKLAGEIKEYFRGVVICGGVHPTLEPDCLERSEGLDAVVIGEGEYAVLDLMDAIRDGENIYSIKNFWFRKGKGIVRNTVRPLIENLDELPLPATHICDWQGLIDDTNGRLRFFFGRGCPFKCTYCSNHALNEIYKDDKTVRYPSVNRCMDEIAFATSKYRFNHLYFADDTFILNRKWTLEFLKAYEKSFNYPFGCQVRANLCSKKMFTDLQGAGCFMVMMGVESGNDYIRNEILKRKMTREQIVTAFADARDAGIKTAAQVIIGLPFETEETIVDTIDLMAEINADEVRHGVFFPYPNTELQRLCIENSFLKKEAYYSDYCERADSILDLPDLSKSRIEYYNDNFISILEEKIKKRGETPMGNQASTNTGFVSSLTNEIDIYSE